MKIFGYEINKSKNPFATVTNAMVNEVAKSNERIDETIPYVQYFTRIHQDISTWRKAIIFAENIHYPNRLELYRMYADIMLDNHLSSLIQNRKSAILSCRFEVINKKGRVDEKLTQLITRKWFYSFCNLSLDSIFFSHSLIQFGDIVDNEFTDIELVPRPYVKPEFSIVVTQPASIVGTSWLEEPYNKWALGIGEKNNLGILAKAGALVLWKKGALEAWSEMIATTGTPLRVLKTDLRDNTSRANGENFLRNAGTSAYGLFDTKDIFEIHESKNTAAADLFNDLIERCNSELSKLLLGATGTIDEKAFVGSAQVHKATLDKINDQDKIFLENVFQYQLIPLLNKHGLGFEGMRIQIRPDEGLDLTAKFAIDSKLLEFYDIPTQYIEETYGTPVLAKAKPAIEDNASVDEVTNQLNYLYGTHE